MKQRVLVSWSSGKDSAWMLSQLQRDSSVEIVGLLTTINDTHDRVAMHGVRRELVEAQAAAADLPVTFVSLPWPCPNGVYEERFAAAVEQAKQDGVTHIAFGDLFLEDIRDYRIGLLEGTGIEPLFPIWCGREATHALAQQMVSAGVRAIVTCLDPSRLDASYAGRVYDSSFLVDLPDDVDACAENGEFHTFCTDAPCFAERVDAIAAETVTRDGYVFRDLVAT